MTMHIQEAYELLGLGHGCTRKQLRTAYCRLSRKFHPDVYHADDGASFRRVKDAYDLLKGSSLAGGGIANIEVPNDTSDLAEKIRWMSASERRFRFCADIEGYENNVRSEYVLIECIGPHSKEWGAIVVAYPLGSHRRVAEAYFRETGTNPRTAAVRGGGYLSIEWLRAADGPLIRTSGDSGTYGRPASLLAVRTCLESFQHDNLGWTIGCMEFDIR